MELNIVIKKKKFQFNKNKEYTTKIKFKIFNKDNLKEMQL